MLVVSGRKFFFSFLKGDRREGWVDYFYFGLVWMQAITDTDQEFDGLLFRHRLSGDKKSTNVLWLTKRRADEVCTQSVST